MFPQLEWLERQVGKIEIGIAVSIFSSRLYDIVLFVTIFLQTAKLASYFQGCLVLYLFDTAQWFFHYSLTAPEVISPLDENLIDFRVRYVILEGLKNSCTYSLEVKTGGCANIVLTSSLLLVHQQNENSFYKRFYCPIKLETSHMCTPTLQLSIVKEYFLLHGWNHLMR